MNIGASWPEPKVAKERVLGIQRKLHKWAQDDQGRRFSDLHNLVWDPATLIVAWTRVRANRGSRSAGVDGQSAAYVEQVLGVQRFLAELREELRSGSYRPLPVKERKIPKRGGKLRRLGIATVRDRVVQAALKLVLEPIFEVDFQPCSYGFRPGRRAQDAIAEVHLFTSHSYEWIVEADIEACFDQLSHVTIADGVRSRIADKRVLSLVKAFLKAGIMSEHGGLEAQLTGTPQGGILSPLMSNIALTALDRHYARAWEEMGDTTARAKRRRHGEANYRLIRYADDFVICVAGERRHAEALVAETEQVIAPLGLKLSKEKTRITHIDEGIEFLGWKIKRQRGRDRRPHVYTYPSKRSLQAVMGKVKKITRSDHNQPLGQLPAPAKPGAQGLVRLLPQRRLLAHLQLPACLHLAAGRSLVAPEAPQGKLALAQTPLPSRVVANPRPRGALQPRRDADNPLPLPRQEHPHAMAEGRARLARAVPDARASGRTDRPMNTGMPVESPVRGDVHAGFGGRVEETERPKGRQRASARPYTFRFNRRHSRHRGMLFYRLLEQAVATDPHPLRTLYSPPPGLPSAA